MNNDGKVLDHFLKDMVLKELTPCVTLSVMKDGKTVYSIAEGYSSLDRSGAVAVSEDTMFNIGSVTKPITASLIVKLAEKGLLTLDDPVIRYIPGYKFGSVTLFHLMTHTAGYDEVVNAGIEWPKSAAELQDYFSKIYAIDALKYPPDSVEAYTTQGYSILMDIIEKVSGQTLEQFARAELFDPLGMQHTTYDVYRLKAEETALPWKKCDKNRFTYLKNTPPTGDSGLYSTTKDLIKFASLFLNEGFYGDRRVFSSAAVNLMLTEMTGGRFWKTPIFWYRGYKNAKGLFGDMNSLGAVGHAGFSGTMLVIDPHYRTAIVFITNSNDIHDDYSNFRKVCNVTLASLIIR
jgi:CubicO group peptidase (beta-lactamase class C family)